MILAESKTATLLSQSEQKLGDVADVVTGFYTGDNLRFIRAASKYVKGAKNYDVVDPTIVTHCTSLYGIPDIEEGYVLYMVTALCSLMNYLQLDLSHEPNRLWYPSSLMLINNKVLKNPLEKYPLLIDQKHDLPSEMLGLYWTLPLEYRYRS